MTKHAVTPTGTESPYGEKEIIVCKTDTKAWIASANDIFLRVSRLKLNQ